MTEDIKVQPAGSADTAKLVVATLLVILGVAGYYVLGDQNVWLRWGCVVAGLVLGALVVAFSAYGTQFRSFMDAARVELRKIVWPTREETGKTTLAVFIFVSIAGLFFWLLDFALAWATRFLTGQGS
ncbi:MAG TPA: preprotein translocase subunit SecE [Burkholderiales bacterium]|jgi:preprotein translocase subunit SecE|nr:preprotein translocase subunit SecE [Burkholderiales bacterium]